MKIISTNIGKRQQVNWRGKQIETGIFKYPTDTPVFLGKTDVTNDSVVDRKHHGGVYKACYLFGSDNYPYWEERYPNLKFDWGIFGENLTVQGLKESELRIGAIYNVGKATVQVTEPRQPCYKLGIRFSNQAIIKQFTNYGATGTYVKVLKEGSVQTGDTFKLAEESLHTLTVLQYHRLQHQKVKDPQLLQLAIQNDAIRAAKREALKKYL